MDGSPMAWESHSPCNLITGFGPMIIVKICVYSLVYRARPALLWQTYAKEPV